MPSWSLTVTSSARAKRSGSKIDVDFRAWHDLQIADIRREDIQELIREKAATSPIEANRLISQITKIFNWAVKEGKRSPWQHVE